MPTPLMIGIYAAPPSSGGRLLMDATPYARACTMATNARGFESLQITIDRLLVDALRFYNQVGMLHVAMTEGPIVVWEGRLEDPAITSDEGSSLSGTCFGYQRALGDLPYTALWSSTSSADWSVIASIDDATAAPERYQFGAGLSIALQNGAVYGNDADGCGWTFATPDGGERPIVTVSIDYDMLLPTDWRLFLQSAERDHSAPVTETVVVSTGSPAVGTIATTLSPGRDRISLRIVNHTGGDYTDSADTGYYYVRATAVRVKTTASASVYADEIAAALAVFVNGVNSSQLSAATALIRSPGLDLVDEAYEDQAPAAILDHLVALGDDQTPPRRWEWSVWNNQQLTFQPRGTTARTWYVDATALTIVRTVDQLSNSVYAKYTDADNVTRRTAAASNGASITRYGVTRRAAVGASTTSSSQAEIIRDAALADTSDPAPRARIAFDRVYAGGGAQWPLWSVRACDTIVIRNLPPAQSAEIDRVRSFRISRTEYDAMTDRLTVEPEAPLPTLDVLIARRSEGI